VDERLDIVDPKNSRQPSSVTSSSRRSTKGDGAYYTPEEITGFMSRQTIHPYLLDQLNDEVGANYEEIDDVFGFSVPDAEGSVEALADGGRSRYKSRPKMSRHGTWRRFIMTS